MTFIVLTVKTGISHCRSLNHELFFHYTRNYPALLIGSTVVYFSILLKENVLYFCTRGNKNV